MVAAAREGGGAWRAKMAALVTSPAVLRRERMLRKSDRTHLRSLFVDLLERRPSERETTALVRAADVLPGRGAPFAALAKVLIDSGEAPIPLLVDIDDPRAWIRDRFLRYLGRPPDPAEMDAYGKALLAPDGGPELVLRALLTCPEYACR
jgi:hypothetical protein